MNKLTRPDLISLGKGAGIAAVGAALAYLSTWLTGTDLGTYGPVVAATLAIVTNIVRKLAI